jgi:hypothetical protein
MADYSPEQQAAVDAYLSGGGDQSAVDAYFAGNPSNEQFLQDAGAYWNVDPATEMATPGESRAIPGTNVKSAGLKGNNWVGGQFSHEDMWAAPVHFDESGKAYYAPGYGPGAEPGSVVRLDTGAPVQTQNAPGGAAPEGSIFDFFTSLFSNFMPQTQQQQQQAKTNLNPSIYAPGSENDPMIIENAIQNQSDPSSMAGLFNRLADSFRTLQQTQGGSQSIMQSGMGYGGYDSSPYQNQYVAPPPPPPPAALPTAQQKITNQPQTYFQDPRVQETLKKTSPYRPKATSLEEF